jgi:hypothetical protein
VQGLEQNCGLVRLDLSNRVVNDANWKALCMSLKAHPTLEVLGLRTTTSSTDRQARDYKTTRKNRMLDLEEMLKVNTLMHTIELGSNECDESLLQHFIRPRLKRNLYLPRLSAMEIGDSLLRAKLLGRALESKQESPDALWMFISQNKDIVACFSSSIIDEPSTNKGSIYGTERRSVLVASCRWGLGNPEIDPFEVDLLLEFTLSNYCIVCIKM